ncbi:MAG: DUF3047 domain-containing protein [Candidatus Thiodiazotropha sp. 6PLUC2]
MYIQPGIGITLSLLPFLAFSQSITKVDVLPVEGWEEVSFKGNTTYSASKDSKGQPSLVAISRGTASALAKRIRINLDETPYLNWRWRIQHILDKPDEQSKGGDDYPARIYVVKEGGWAPWRTRSLNYVWSSSQAVGTVWPSAYTDQSMMVSVNSGDSEAGQWQSERRNIKKDFKAYFGEDITEIDVVAIMTDTDNTDSTATAWYSDIYFSSK